MTGLSRQQDMVTGLADASDGAGLDPFKILADSGEEKPVSQLAELDLEHLRDIVAQFGMDPRRPAMKWKEPRRVREHIVATTPGSASFGSARAPDEGLTLKIAGWLAACRVAGPRMSRGHQVTEGITQS